jgi:aldehyde:ferredoxin oxidoreductase
MNGYAGKILRLNLTERIVSEIPTSDYAEWGGGHGMGSAIFFDLVKDKTIDGFDPANVVTIMTSPLCGTLVPAAGGRTEVQGIGVQSYPIGWFTRGNFGGRFSAMLKYAGWDGIVLEGKAEVPGYQSGSTYGMERYKSATAKGCPCGGGILGNVSKPSWTT